MIEPPLNVGGPRSRGGPRRASRSSAGSRRVGADVRAPAGATGTRSRPARRGLPRWPPRRTRHDDRRVGKTRPQRPDVRADHARDRGLATRRCGRTSRCSSSGRARRCGGTSARCGAAACVPQMSSPRAGRGRSGAARAPCRRCTRPGRRSALAGDLVGEVPREDRRVRLQLRQRGAHALAGNRPQCAVRSVQLPGESTGPTPCQTRMPAASRRSSSGGLSGCWARVAFAWMRFSRATMRSMSAAVSASPWPGASSWIEAPRSTSRSPLSSSRDAVAADLAQADAPAPRGLAGNVERRGRRGSGWPGAQSAGSVTRSCARTMRAPPCPTVTGAKRERMVAPSEPVSARSTARR